MQQCAGSKASQAAFEPRRIAPGIAQQRGAIPFAVEKEEYLSRERIVQRHDVAD